MALKTRVAIGYKLQGKKDMKPTRDTLHAFILQRQSAYILKRGAYRAILNAQAAVDAAERAIC